MAAFACRVVGRGEGTLMLLLQRPHTSPFLRSVVLSRLESCAYIQFPQSCTSKILCGLTCGMRGPVTVISNNRGYRSLLPKILTSKNSNGQPSESDIKLSGFEYDQQRVALALSKSFQKTVMFVKNLLYQLVKILLVVSGSFFLSIALAPWLLSSHSGLQTSIYLINKVIPGHANVQSLSLGWKKPIVLEQLHLKDVNGDNVLSLSRLETKAPLWSLVCGKAGLGDCTITSLAIDLQEDKNSGFSKLALSVVPQNKLPKSRRQVKVASGISRKRKMESAIESMLSASIRAPGGGLKVMDGKVLLPGDIACVLGKNIFFDVFLGHWATAESEDLNGSSIAKTDVIPIKVAMWSDFTQGEALGFLSLRKMELELIKPVKVEMDLHPKVAQLYLARMNPLLGEIAGPIVQEEDMPDVVMYVTPENLLLPTELYNVRFEPMKAILARGPLAGGILNLVSMGKQDITQGRNEATVQTSAINADIHMDGSLKCSRIDLLIAEKVHVATWGQVDWIDETVKVILAIPGITFRNVFGLSNLPPDYQLQIPVGGTLEQPQVDWKSAGIGVAQLTLQQRSRSLLMKILSHFETNEKSVPEPVGNFRWASQN